MRRLLNAKWASEVARCAWPVVLLLIGLALLSSACAEESEGTTPGADAAETGKADDVGDEPMVDAGVTDTRTPTVVRVMTVNLRHNADHWDRRFELIADEIVRLDPDLIGLQEVEIFAGQLGSLRERIRDRGGADYEGFQRLKTGLWAFSGEGIAILSRYPIQETGVLSLGEGRIALRTRVSAGGTVIDFFNTHFHHKGGDAVRLPQAEKLSTWIENVSNGAALLTGDLNARPSSETIQHLKSSGLVDSFREIHGEETAKLGNTHPIVLAEGAFEQSPNKRIDYVFTRDVLAVDAEVVLRNHDAEGYYPSDHLAVMTTVEVGSDPEK